jgi:hypothetical protein
LPDSNVASPSINSQTYSTSRDRLTDPKKGGCRHSAPEPGS